MGNKSSSSLQSLQFPQEQNRTDNVFLLHSNEYNARQRLSSRSNSLPTNSLRVLSYQYNTWTNEGMPIHPEEYQTRRHSTVSFIPQRNRVQPIDLRTAVLSHSSTTSTNSPRSGASSSRSTGNLNSPRQSPRRSPRSASYSPRVFDKQISSATTSPSSDPQSPRVFYSTEGNEEEVNLSSFRLTSSKYSDKEEGDASSSSPTSFINPLNAHHMSSSQHHSSHNHNHSNSNVITPLEKPNLRAHPKRIMATPLTQLYAKSSSERTSFNTAGIPYIFGTANAGPGSSSSGTVAGSPFKPSSPTNASSNQQAQIRRYSLSGYTMQRRPSVSTPTHPSLKSPDQVVNTSFDSHNFNPSSPVDTPNCSSPTDSSTEISSPTPNPRSRSSSVTTILIQTPPRLNPIAFFTDSHKRKQPPTVALTTPNEPPCFDHLLNPPQESLPKKPKTKRDRSYSLPSNSPKSAAKGARSNVRY